MAEVAEQEPVALLPQDREVFDADKESDKDKNRRIAAELFKDDDEEKEPAPQVKVEPKLESPPAQRRREAPKQQKAPESGEATQLTQDAKGRYHRADGTVASKEEVAAVQPKAEDSPYLEAPKAEEPAAPVVENVPLEFLAYGQNVAIPGALYKPGHGAFIPESEIPSIRQAWARGVIQYPKLQAENERLRTAQTQTYTRKEAEADALLNTVGGYFKDPQTLAKFAQDVLQNPEFALRQLRLSMREQELTLSQNVQQPDLGTESEPDASEIAESFTDELDGFFFGKAYGLQGVFTPKEQQAIRTAIFQRAPEFLQRVDRDLDETGNPVVSSQQIVAVKKGEVLVNRTRLLAELNYAKQQKNGATGGSPAPTPAVTNAGNGSGQSPAPVRRVNTPPSAVGRSRAQVPSASPPSTGQRRKDSGVPTHSIKAASDYFFGDD